MIPGRPGKLSERLLTCKNPLHSFLWSPGPQTLDRQTGEQFILKLSSEDKRRRCDHYLARMWAGFSRSLYAEPAACEPLLLLLLATAGACATVIMTQVLLIEESKRVWTYETESFITSAFKKRTFYFKQAPLNNRLHPDLASL